MSAVNPPISGRFLLNRGRERLSLEERRALEEAFDPPKTVAARATVTRRGQPISHSTMLIDGVMCRYLDDHEGRRQLLGMHVAGDFIDLHGFPLEHLDHDIAAISPVRIASIPRARMAVLIEKFPNLARMLWRSTMYDAAIHREWIFRLGRLEAKGRVAHFFSEMDARLRLAEIGSESSAPLPLNQTDIAEACGLTSVHVNRVLRQLREDGLATFRSGALTIGNRAMLHRLAEFDYTYLYPDTDAPQTRPSEPAAPSRWIENG